MQRHVELGVAVFTAIVGIIGIIGSLRVGITWGVEGPRAGFFPFYLGLFIVISSAVNLIRVFPDVRKEKMFAEWTQLSAVMQIFVPTLIYVILIPFSGIYLASMLLIALFMKWLGRFSWLLTLAIAIGVPVLIYFTFERWFLVALPKGPIEDYFNL
jgi:putative tricarboxylic transport membrane protein